MKSPFTGGDATLMRESRPFEYRKESFDIVYHFYRCIETEESFTTTELDNLNMIQVHNKYRAKFGIPFTDEIKSIREKYGLSAAKMSEVLGLGINVYRQYESGDMPSVATGRLIRLAEDPQEFKKLVEMSRNTFVETEYERLLKKIHSALHGWSKFEDLLYQYLFPTDHPSLLNGFRVPSLDRIGKMVQYFAQENRPFTNGMNKLMFYADFTHFKHHGISISGLCYLAVQRGPIPCNYGSIYDHSVKQGFVKVAEVNFGDFVGDQFYSEMVIVYNHEEGPFSHHELSTLEKISKYFKGKTTKEIVHVSHGETRWKENMEECNKISYEYSFELTAID